MAYRIADSSMWQVNSGPSIAEQFNRVRCYLRPAPKGPGSRHNGYVEVRQRIAGNEDGPMLYAFTTCHNGFWRTMPDLVLDDAKYGLNSEQIETDQEDHCSDEVMYACVSRPWMRHVDKEKPKEDTWMRFDKPEEESWITA